MDGARTLPSSVALLVGLTLLVGCDRGGGEDASTTAQSKPGTAVSVLGELTVASEISRAGYDRELFEHWIDADMDGCDTRDDVLIAESLEPAVIGPDCSLSGGQWYSAYDGVTTSDPGDLDIDHFVPLAEAWDSGAAGWTVEQRRDFANDLAYEGSLISVSASSNRSKSDRDPAEWKPPEHSYWCTYAVTWVAVKLRWDLTADPPEVDALALMLDACPAPTASTAST